MDDTHHRTLTRAHLDGTEWHATLELDREALHVLPHLRVERVRWPFQALVVVVGMLAMNVGAWSLGGLPVGMLDVLWAALLGAGSAVYLARQNRMVELTLAELSTGSQGDLQSRLNATPRARSHKLATLTATLEDSGLELHTPQGDLLRVDDEFVAASIRDALSQALV